MLTTAAEGATKKTTVPSSWRCAGGEEDADVHDIDARRHGAVQLELRHDGHGENSEEGKMGLRRTGGIRGLGFLRLGEGGL